MNAFTPVQSPVRVNGIPVDDVRALIDRVADDPAAGQTSWRVATTWQGQTHSRGVSDGFQLGGAPVARSFRIDIDEPVELGGADLFANPQEYLLAALNACMTVGFTALCALNGVEIEHLSIVTDGDIDLRGFFGLAAVPPGYASLRTVVTVRGSADEAEFQRIFQAALATSPNVHNIGKPVAIDPVLVVL
jgi:uncharacterized OsmC-like protein